MLLVQADFERHSPVDRFEHVVQREGRRARGDATSTSIGTGSRRRRCRGFGRHNAATVFGRSPRMDAGPRDRHLGPGDRDVAQAVLTTTPETDDIHVWTKRRLDIRDLARVADQYTTFFHSYDAAPLFVVDAQVLNPVDLVLQHGQGDGEVDGTARRSRGDGAGSDAAALLSDTLCHEWGLKPSSVTLAGGAGDNAAAAVGIGAVKSGEGILSMGTLGVLFAVTDRLVTKPHRALNAMCHALPNRWHVMGVTLSAASALSWFAETIGRGDKVGDLIAEVEAFAADADRRRHAPIFVPYLTGERTPHNDPEANGIFAGIRAQHGAVAMAYAVMEGVAFCFADDFDVLADAQAGLKSCFLVGGGARSRFWGQMLADVISFPLDLPDGAETGGAQGAARLAMLASGAGTEAEICIRPGIKLRYEPNPEGPTLYGERLARFRALYQSERRVRGL